jgi:hypothetical protein
MYWLMYTISAFWRPRQGDYQTKACLGHTARGLLEKESQTGHNKTKKFNVLFGFLFFLLLYCPSKWRAWYMDRICSFSGLPFLEERVE